MKTNDLGTLKKLVIHNSLEFILIPRSNALWGDYNKLRDKLSVAGVYVVTNGVCITYYNHDGSIRARIGIW